MVVPCFNERRNVAELVRRLDAVLGGIAWEAIFVDDDSPDGTAEAVRAIAAIDPRVRCLQRLRRRGLASAVIEGVMATAAPIVAVMDGDLQHDEARLPAMVARVASGDADIVVASRFLGAGDAAGLASARRQALSAAGIRLAQRFLPARLSDPLSGFFVVRHAVFLRAAPRLTGEGFKILLDLLLSTREAPRVEEIAATLRPRFEGESKLGPLVLLQFAALLLDKALGGRVPLRFVAFCAVGALGVVVQLAVVAAALLAGAGFVAAQATGTLAAMVANFLVNNSVTYRDARLRGPRLVAGLALFMLVCGVGAVANVGVARALTLAQELRRTPAAAVGAVIGVVWNYVMSATLVWGRRP